jgi:hypothetical protein
MRVIAASRIQSNTQGAPADISSHLIQVFASRVVFIIDGVGQIETNFGDEYARSACDCSSTYLIDAECAPVHRQILARI